MRQKIFIVAFLAVLFCFNSVYAQKEIFIKQIEFKLDNISDVDYENEYFMTMKLNKGSTYKFKITNHRDNYTGKAVMELMDADNLILTNQLNDKYFETLSFICNKTGFYDILIRYKDKKPGNSVIDIVLLQ
ncbi:MAG: hypothetical protein JXR41_14980 [Bacteroidales bacterium]|nr:hypothetical protein [Bacteroidales bacterium]MBN2764396.1 hypothetical protein [Bacteroidales bacterium]